VPISAPVEVKISRR